MIDEIVELGFSNIELSHGMMITKLPGILDAYQKGKFNCVGVHNYFPSPVEVMIDAPDVYEYTSHRPYDRKRALDLTYKSLEMANRFEADYMVLHMGSVPMKPKRWTNKLTQWVKDEKDEEKRYTRVKERFIKKRAKIGKVYYERAIEALEEIAEKAAEAGVKLAIESRSRYEDMPTETEMIALQEHFKDNPWVGYWHDFGHVQLKHNIHLLEHKEWLEKMEPYLLGGHIHDVYHPERDHRVPLTGEIDFPELLKFFKPEMPHTWELSPTRKPEQIREMLVKWKQLFPETL
ncbi:sugar phosphate isomerase/epimerase family protein [Rubritalea sp.]|uniref:sugar phosphate isomerase/epimerase family protein n=1 Tax=Rubritalea sp. TaxID=2109375 RepID=UPI003EF6C0DC